MNLHLSASVEASIKGKIKVLNERFDLLQTPTFISYKLIQSSNVKDEYCKWVIENSAYYNIPIHEVTDIFGEKEPIGYETISDGKLHIEELEKWLKEHEDWEINWSVW
jgi:hypothetical protein